MELKSILVLVQGASTAAAAVRAACTLAERHEASVVGLFVVDIWSVASVGGGEAPAQLYDLEHEKLLAEAAEAERIFRSVSGDTRVETEWRCVEGMTQPLTDLHARHCDLLCVAAADSRIHGRGGFSVNEDLLFTTGRPVLVVPASYSDGAIGDNVAVAWDASRESARATTDAMGILKKAGSVSVVTVADNLMSDRESDVIGLDICRYLAQHDVHAEAHTAHPGDTPVGKALHDWAREQGKDLLIMGAYGHSRFHEMVLGGTTRWILRHTDIPLMMSH